MLGLGLAIATIAARVRLTFAAAGTWLDAGIWNDSLSWKDEA